MVKRCALLAGAAIGLAGLLTFPAAAGSMPAHAVPDIVASGVAPLAARPDPDRVLSFTVELPLRDRAGLESLIGHLTDPRDPAFRHWLGVQEFADRFGPSDADYQAVRRALSAGGVTPDRASPSRLVVDAHGRIADVERLLHVRFGLYRHPTESRLFLAPDREPSLDVAAPVLGMAGLDDLDRPVSHAVHATERAGGTGSGPNGQFTGPDVRQAYYGHGPLTGAGQSVGLFEFGSYDPADVAAYFSRIGAPFSVPVVTVALDGVDPVCSAHCNDAEQALDIEEAISVAPGLDRVVFYTGKTALPIMAQMASDDICAVLSVSWGWRPNPTLDEPVLEEMAAQGQSFLVATGDFGFHLAEGGVWPSDDTWAIAVGGTDLVTAGAGGPWKSERGWRFSGGGPSPDGIPIPSWQKPFIDLANSGSLKFRNVPDIAGQANTDNFSCYSGQCNGGNGGTSYAAPIWAGFLALANQQAAQAGLPSVGFFTPALYSRFTPGTPPQVLLHDEIAGFNGKYHASTGFDLVTGFGSPFGALTFGALAPNP